MCNTREVRRQFGFGLRRHIARGIWDHIEKSWYPELNQLELAVELGFESGASVSRGLDKGELTLESLAVILTITGREWSHLPSLPAKRDRVLAGYCQALAYQRGGPNATERPADHEVLCLAYLHAHRDRRDREAIAADVVKRVENELRVSLPVRTRKPPPSPATYLDELNRAWGQAYLCAVEAVSLEVPK